MKKMICRRGLLLNTSRTVCSVAVIAAGIAGAAPTVWAASPTSAPHAVSAPHCEIVMRPNGYVTLVAEGLTGTAVEFRRDGVLKDSGHPSADGSYWHNINASESREGWTGQEGQAGTFPCTDLTAKQPGTDSTNTEYDKGFKSGFQAIKDNCAAKQPNGLGQTDPNWQSGYDNGAALAAKTFCGDKTGGGQ
ncbi:hypothetical protein [Streptomyces sp. NPDC051109]|uniref:hypothetical protein n=1 Tax=Streptomyces sp. NPDC051109 TaxID=3365642 RepID=UPI0037A7A73D